MLVDSNDCRVELQFIKVDLLEFGEDVIPETTFTPPIEALKDRVPVAETCGKIPPWDTSFQDKEDRIDKESIILCGEATVSRFTGE